tara:strand:+ start:429 stop:698 length:270 start_codon:yes stop_codon:yes gene_type:complete
MKSPPSQEQAQRYWKANLRLMSSLIITWFLVSFGAGILWVDTLNQISWGGFKLGFWFAQQGSIYCFVILIFIYVVGSNRLERKYGVEED